MQFQTDLTSAGLANYKRRPSVTSSGNSNSVTKYPALNTAAVNSTAAGFSLSKPVPSKRPQDQQQQQHKSSNKKDKPKVSEAKPTFSTFKQFHRTASLSDLINDNDQDANVVINSSSSKHRKKQIQLETASLASVDVNVPDPILPPTKSITVQTDEVDLNFESKGKSDPLRISTEPLNGVEVSLSTSFDSMDDSKSKSTDVSMEDALQEDASNSKDLEDDEDEEDLPTPPATPPAEERLKSPVSTTSRSPPSPNHTMTPIRKVHFLEFDTIWHSKYFEFLKKLFSLSRFEFYVSFSSRYEWPKFKFSYITFGNNLNLDHSKRLYKET